MHMHRPAGHEPGDSRYFDRYPESKDDKMQPLTAAQQELFKDFGPYS